MEQEQEPGVAARARILRLQGLVDNVRSAWNVGSIFRSAEGFGFGHLYLCGITPTPEKGQVKKTALGAEEFVGWSTHRNAVQLVTSLREQGHCIWALERTAGSRLLEEALVDSQESRPTILVVGNERAGIDPGVLSLANQVVHLAMAGRKRSFNVSVAFAVAAHMLQAKTLQRDPQAP